jgi:L-threonylcarbamoyladenylate synthase
VKFSTQILPVTSPPALDLAREHLDRGEPIAFPTDTVYGLGVRYDRADAVDKLFLIKKRDRNKAIPILIGDLNQIYNVALEIQPRVKKLAQVFWPGPLTIIVPKTPLVPLNVSPFDTVGIRMPDHPDLLSLMQSCGPLAATSANRSGEPDPLNANQVLQQLNGLIPLILDGSDAPGQQPSTVIDCTGNSVLLVRKGPIDLGEILQITG